MRNPEPHTKAIRTLLFRKAEIANQGLLRRLGDTARHLSNNNELAVLGTLQGLESEVESIRTLMVLARDHFKTQTSKEES